MGEKPCSCTSYCRGQSGLANGFLCAQDNPGIHERLMQLPAGKTCADCGHVSRCLALGFTEAGNSQCDFYPSSFVPTARKPEHVRFAEQVCRDTGADAW